VRLSRRSVAIGSPSEIEKKKKNEESGVTWPCGKFVPREWGTAPSGYPARRPLGGKWSGPKPRPFSGDPVLPGDPPVLVPRVITRSGSLRPVK